MALIRVALDRAECLKGLKAEENNDIIETLSKLPPVPETNLDEDGDKMPSAPTTSVISTTSGNTGNNDLCAACRNVPFPNRFCFLIILREANSATASSWK